ncbi:MAG: S1 RNA-binding domain-containing protein [Chloroflexi bacterium]|nr:S1 RNA-binding domain-containing protein [Chloroflexota bacterium]
MIENFSQQPQSSATATMPPPETPAATMQELLAESSGLPSARRGEIMDGVVIRVDRDGALVDIGTKSEGVIPQREMRCLGYDGLGQLKVGDPVLAYVLDIENEQVILSLDKAQGEKGWRFLQQCCTSGELVEGKISGHNRGGLLVNIQGVQGFVPLSQIVSAPPPSSDAQSSQDGEDTRLAGMAGQMLKLKVLEINRQRNRVILSERSARPQIRQEARKALLKELREGEVRRGRVSGIRDFGVFVDLGGMDGLVPLSELSWDPGVGPRDAVKEGEDVEVVVMRVNQENGRVALSLRRANAQPWAAVAEKYQVGQLVNGTVTKLATFGAFARLEGPVEGLIHISELADHRIANPQEVVRVGDQLILRIIKMEPERRRLGLSLRRAQERL